jgi:hypothetical protein
MYRDIGLDNWFFEIDGTDGDELWLRLEKVVRKPSDARAYASAAMERVHALQGRMGNALRQSLLGI